MGIETKFGGKMRKILLILLFVSTLLNAQKLLFDKSEPELNPNPYFDFSYTELVVNITFDTDTWWVKTNATISEGKANIIANGGYIKKTILTNNSIFVTVFTIGGYVSGSAGMSGDVTTATDRFPSANGTFTRIFKADGGIPTDFKLVSTIAGVTFDNVSVKKLIAPTGWTSGTMDANNYVIEDTGCKFVEATGTTYIQMSDTLDAGYYKLKVTQDWTQGKLWAYNGITTYNFPQADGEYTVKIYLPGNKPLVIGCDNNTISTITYLSVR